MTTLRLVLEPQVAAHAEAMFAVLSDPAIYEFENAAPASLATLRERFRKLEARRSPDGCQAWLNWVVLLKPGLEAIGYVQATVYDDRRALVAYEFGSRWWGRGLATEAVVACLENLRRVHAVRCVGAVFKRPNQRSRKLLARIGMRPPPPGGFPSELCGEDEDALVMALTSQASAFQRVAPPAR